MRVDISKAARRDIVQASNWLGTHYPAYGDRLLPKITAAIESLERNALLYQLRPDIAPNARRLNVDQLSIIYEVFHDVVVIDRVLYARRNLSKIMERSIRPDDSVR